MRREEGREEYIEKLKKKWEIKENESKEQKKKEKKLEMLEFSIDNS